MAETPASTKTRRPVNVKKVGKPWPGPPLAGTSNKNNIHLKLNLINLSKVKHRKHTPRREAEEGNENEPQKGKEDGQSDVLGVPSSKPERRPSVMGDVLVITVLWSMGIIHIVIDTFKERYFSDVFTLAEADTIDKVTEDKFVLIYTVIPMLTVGTGLTFSCGLPILEFLQESKFWVMFVGLSVYSASAGVGVILAASRNTAVGIFLAWQEVTWFWFIFHQRFPISVRLSHLLVSGNILVIEVTQFIVNAQVKNAKHPFSRLFFGVSFGIAAVVAVGWFVGIHFIQRFMNSALGGFGSVREVYAQTEVIENFDRRQTSSSILLFVALIYPAAIFSIASAYVDFGHIKLIENALTEDLGVSSYRPDLITAFLVVMIVEGALQCLRPIRNEFTDLVVIVVAHLINIIAVMMIMHILYETKDTRNKFPERDEATLIVSSNYDESWFLQVGDDFNQWHLGHSYVIIKNVPDDGIVPIRFVRPKTGEVTFVEYVEIQMSRNLSVNGYNFLRFESGYQLVKIPTFPPIQYIYEDKARIFFSNGLEECTDYNKTAFDECKFDPDTTRGGRVQGKCLPLSMKWLQNGTDDEKVIPIKLPADNDVIMFEIPCDRKKPTESDSTRECITPPMTSYFHKLDLYLGDSGGKMAPMVWGGIRPYNFIMVRIYESGLQKTPKLTGSSMIMYRTHREISLVIIMTLYGVSLGFAWVGYMHFIWIQCPVKYRMFIIYTFFALTFTASALTKRYLLKFNENSVLLLMVFVIVCFIWQSGATVLFIIRTKRSRKKEQPQRAWRRY